MQEWGDKTLRDSRGVPLHIFMKMQSQFINKQDMIFLDFPNYSMRFMKGNVQEENY